MVSESPVRTGIRLRALRAHDLPEVLRIEGRSFSSPWSARAFRSLLDRPDTCLIAAVSGSETGSRLLGFAAAWFRGEDGELGDLAVAPAARRRGIGRRLVEEILAEARRREVARLSLQVRVSNVAARSLYAGVGFSVVGRRPSYYRAPAEDALVLRWKTGQSR